MIIGITGYARSGKDTLADHIVKTDKSFTKYNFADPIKETARVLFGFTDEQLWGEAKDNIDSRYDMSPREALQLLGTEVMQYLFPEKLPMFDKKIGREFWVKKFEILYEETKKGNLYENYVIADVRFPHEVEMIHKYGGKVYCVTRESKIPDKTNLHSSESHIETLDVDKEYFNNGSLYDLYALWGKNGK